MTVQEKVLYIIDLLELSDRQVGEAIDKKKSTVSHKRLNIGFNKFKEEDFKKLREFYIDKLDKIKQLK